MDSYNGKTEIENVKKIIYLGVTISCDGKNTENINNKRNKSFGTHRQIMIMVREIGKYTMECGFIYLNSILRGSILYGAEAMMNMTEKDFRNMEKMEEEQMRLLFEKGKSCQIHLMYLEAGQSPARFQIKRMQLNMFYYIYIFFKSFILDLFSLNLFI